MAISLASLRTNTTRPPRIVIYGTTGVGKTDFASCAPNPVFLGAEDGLADIEGIKAWDISSYKDAIDAISVLYHDKHDFQTVVLDTADAFEPMVWAQVCATVKHEKGKPITNILDYGWGKGFEHASPLWTEFLAGLTALRNERSMCVIVCAHAKVQTVKSPDADDYEKFALRLDRHAEMQLRGWCDAMFFADYVKTVIATGREGQDRHRAVGKGDRVIYTEERPAFYAKNRYSLPPVLPFLKGQGWNTFVTEQAKAHAAKAASPAAMQPVTTSAPSPVPPAVA